jgi:hypothetical protein
LIIEVGNEVLLALFSFAALISSALALLLAFALPLSTFGSEFRALFQSMLAVGAILLQILSMYSFQRSRRCAEVIEAFENAPASPTRTPSSSASTAASENKS